MSGRIPMPKKNTPKVTTPPPPRERKIPLLPPPQGFEYQAFGFLAGDLIDKGDPYSLLVGGEMLAIKGFDDRLLRWLDSQEKPISGYFGLYPKSTRTCPGFWAKSFQAVEPEIEPGTFLIDGQLFSTKGGEHLIRIHRNQTNSLEKPFLVKVSGFLPNSKTGQFWELECVWENGQFSLLDGHLFRGSAL
jgi:hypothetical protein